MRPATGSSGSASAMHIGRPEPNGRRAVSGLLDTDRGRALIPGGETSAPWRAVLERLRHPDVWGPGGLYPLEAFRRTGRGWVARCPGGAHPDRHPSFSMPDGRSFGRCFACGYRRTWIGFVLERQGHSPDARGPAFRSALAVLAERAGMPLDEPARSAGREARPATAGGPRGRPEAGPPLRPPEGRRLPRLPGLAQRSGRDDSTVAHRCVDRGWSHRSRAACGPAAGWPLARAWAPRPLRPQSPAAVLLRGHRRRHRIQVPEAGPRREVGAQRARASAGPSRAAASSG